MQTIEKKREVTYCDDVGYIGLDNHPTLDDFSVCDSLVCGACTYYPKIERGEIKKKKGHTLVPIEELASQRLNPIHKRFQSTYPNSEQTPGSNPEYPIHFPAHQR